LRAIAGASGGAGSGRGLCSRAEGGEMSAQSQGKLRVLFRIDEESLIDDVLDAEEE
jgi:hypothetical protein